MAQDNQLEVFMKINRRCKHSVRYDAIDEVSKRFITSAYLANAAWEVLGQPDSIKIVVMKS